MERIDHFQEKTKVSDAVAGELYQGLATSFPEMSTMFVSIVFFALNPVVGIAANVGSWVFQFMPVIGIPALFSEKALHVDKYEVIRAVLYYTVTLFILAYAVHDGIIHLRELWCIIGLWITFMYRTIQHWPKLRKKRWLKEQPLPDHHLEETPMKKQWYISKVTKFLPNYVTRVIPGPSDKKWYIGIIPLGFILSLLVVGISVYLLVWVVESLGAKLGISVAFLSLTILATITSLPELATNIPLAKKGKGDQIIGNAVWSNSIDIAISTCLMIVIAALLQGRASFPIHDTQAILISIYLLAGIAIAFLLLLYVRKRKIGKTEWRILILAYFLYVIVNYFNFQ